MPAPRTIAHRLLASAAIAALALCVSDAHAQDAAAAEALFTEGKQLAAESRWSEACPKFEASHAADPSVGTLLNWADCLEKEGRLASALLRFRQAEEQLRAANDPRGQVAGERRAALEPRAPRLLLRSPSAPPAGLAVHVDGAAIPLEGVAAAGVERPIDPGPHAVEIRRGDRVLERRDGEATEGVVFELTLDLAAIDRAHPAPAPAAPGRPPPDEPPSKAPLVVGWILTGTGGAALVTGGVLGILALGEQSDAEEYGACRGTVCAPSGVAASQSAGDLAEAAQWVGIAGVGLVAVGITLIATAPSSDEPASSARPAEPTMRLLAGPGRLSVDGRF